MSNKEKSFFSRFKTKQAATKYLDGFVQGLSDELVRRRKLQLRFQAKIDAVSKAVRDKYAGCPASELLGNTSDVKILAHARNLGFSPSICAPYKPGNLKPRSLTRQATDYIRLWLQFTHYFEQLITQSCEKKLDRELEYDYYEHLSQ